MSVKDKYLFFHTPSKKRTKLHTGDVMAIEVNGGLISFGRKGDTLYCVHEKSAPSDDKILVGKISYPLAIAEIVSAVSGFSFEIVRNDSEYFIVKFV